ncbi:uncharacterized protein V6R79_014571 [Siganus canaliculatus]
MDRSWLCRAFLLGSAACWSSQTSVTFWLCARAVNCEQSESCVCSGLKGAPHLICGSNNVSHVLEKSPVVRTLGIRHPSSGAETRSIRSLSDPERLCGTPAGSDRVRDQGQTLDMKT